MSTLPNWFGTYCVMLGAGGIFTLAFLYVLTPGRVLMHLGTLPGLTGNWVSVERVPVTLLGFAVWFSADGDIRQLIIGFGIVVFGLALDRLDGKIVRWVLSRLRFVVDLSLIKKDGHTIRGPWPKADSVPLTKDNQLWAWFEVKETTITRVPRKIGSKRTRKVRMVRTVMKRVLLEDWIHRLTPYRTMLPMFHVERVEEGPWRGLHLKLTRLGEVIDPGADKLCFLPVYAYMAWLGNVQTVAMLAMIAVDLFGTILRRPFGTMPGLSRLQKLVGEEKASPWGKTKVAFQIATLLVDMPASAGWLTTEGQRHSYWLVTGLLWVSVVTGVLSVLSRLTLWQSLINRVGLARFNRRFRKFYEHDVTG